MSSKINAKYSTTKHLKASPETSRKMALAPFGVIYSMTTACQGRKRSVSALEMKVPSTATLVHMNLALNKLI